MGVFGTKMMLEDQNATLSNKLDQYSGGISDKDRNLLINQIKAECRANFTRELVGIKKQLLKSYNRIKLVI